jgi:tetratricopeptide (TPR) repeat protein
MAAARTFLRKYWILIVIVLWVIAWANRDWLAGQAPAGEDASAEEAPIEVPRVVREVEAGEAVAAAEPSLPAPETAPAEPETAPEPEPVTSAPNAPARATEAEAEVETDRPAVEPEVRITAAPVTEPVVEREARVAPTAVEEPAELLSRARSVARSRGPGAAAAVIAAGLRELPADAPERADLFGEMGNYYFTAGNFTAALASYDAALRALPEEERVSMLSRLAPIYERYHPAGRSHLDQFR